MLNIKFKQLLIIIVFLSLEVHAQISNEERDNPIVYKNEYLKYLVIPDSNTRASLMNVSYQYLYLPKSNAFRTGGMHINIGLNIARFFTRKFIFGISYDLKQFVGFTNQHFSQNFLSDFNSNFIPIYSNGKDSTIGYTLKDAINNKDMFGIQGNTFENFGISISIFPQKFGGFLIALKKGNRLFPFFGANNSKLLDEGDGGYLYLAIKNCYSMEVSFKPYRFFNYERIVLNNLKFKDLYKFIVVTLYCEQLTLQNSTFYRMPINHFVNQSFISKYSNIKNFGLKIGLALY
jgi:hypothetical protein